MFKLFKGDEAKVVVHDGMTLEQVFGAMRQLMAAVTLNHHLMGQLYNHVVRKKLAEKAGFKDAHSWFSKYLVELSQATLTQYGAVAAAFSEEATQLCGVSRLHLLLAYMKAANLVVSREAPGEALIEVPGDNGEVATKRFAVCTAEELRRAIQHKRHPNASLPVPPEVETLGERYQEAVTSLLPAGVRVTVQARNHKGTVVLDFKGIPVGQEHQLAAVLMGQVPAVREVRRVAQEEAQPA